MDDQLLRDALLRLEGKVDTVSTGLARVEERLASGTRDGDRLHERVAVLEDRVGEVESTVLSLSGKQKIMIGLLILLGGALGGSAGQLVRAALGGG